MKLIIDNWNNRKNKEESIVIADVLWLEAILARLDGNKHTSLCLSTENSYLIVSGCPNKYIVNIIEGKDECFYNLLGEFSPNNSLVEIVNGGQVSEFEEKYIIDFYLALKAIEYYYLYKQADPSLTWEVE